MESVKSLSMLLLLAVSWSCCVNAASEDLHAKCEQWASSGECEANPSYMLESCALSCALDKSSHDSEASAEDKHEKCPAWALSGECASNPNYMLRNCRKSCHVAPNPDPVVPADFYSISERDIYGNLVYFEQFRGKNVYIVNVASQCGYTAENYKILQLLSQLRSEFFEILIFPCNQFGGQEPGDADEISYFAQQFGFEGRVMAKGHVNGPNAGPTFSFLKSQTGKKHVSWNFDGKFLVNSSGEVEEVTTDSVVETVKQKLHEDAMVAESIAADL